MGRHRRILGVLALLLLTAALLGDHVAPLPVRADHADGNMTAEVNYFLVEEGVLRVCDNSSLITTTQFNDGLAYWNDGLGWTALVSSCEDFGVELIDVPNGACGVRSNGNPVGACTNLPSVDSPQVRLIRVAPFLALEESNASDNVFFPFVVAHELGHNLGMAHWDSPNCANSIMNDPRCDPPANNILTAITQLDKDNYHDGYHADAVASFEGNQSAGPNAIRFAWDGSDVEQRKRVEATGERA